MKKNQYFSTLLLAISAVTSYSTSAAPINLIADGAVINASGSLVGALGANFNANSTFDLDATNAYSTESYSPVGEPAYTQWTFFGSPYLTSFTTNIGLINDTSVSVETVNNFDADAFGNPFGITGIVDVFLLSAGNIIVDCSNGTVDPVTGCDDPNAPWLGGIDIRINFISNSNWFGEGVLPTDIPAFGDLIGVFGSGEEWESGGLVGEFEIQYNSLSVSSVSAVPVPAAAWLFGSALLGLGAMKRRSGSG
jgi:hypothetical protein